MNKLKTSAIAGILTTAGAVGLLGVSAQAATTNPQSDIIERIAKKFNVKNSDVKQVFDEAHKEREANRQTEVSTALQEKVDAGIITAEQKTKLEAKLKELRTTREAERKAENAGARPDHAEMKTKREAERTALKTWAQENNIDLDAVLPQRMGGEHHGPGADRE